VRIGAYLCPNFDFGIYLQILRVLRGEISFGFSFEFELFHLI